MVDHYVDMADLTIHVRGQVIVQHSPSPVRPALHPHHLDTILLKVEDRNGTIKSHLATRSLPWLVWLMLPTCWQALQPRGILESLLGRKCPVEVILAISYLLL